MDPSTSHQPTTGGGADSGAALPIPPRKLQRTKSQLLSDKLEDELKELLETARSLRIQAQKVAAETDHVRRQVSRWCGSHHDEYSELDYCSPEKREQLQSLGEEVLRAISTIKVDVSSMRDVDQAAAYAKAIHVVEGLEARLLAARRAWSLDGLEALAAEVLPLFNACSPEPSGVLDHRFQSLVLGCSLMDQKAIRYRVSDLRDDVEVLKQRIAANPSPPPGVASSESPVSPAASAGPTAGAGAGADPPQHAAASASGSGLHGDGDVDVDGHGAGMSGGAGARSDTHASGGLSSPAASPQPYGHHPRHAAAASAPAGRHRASSAAAAAAAAQRGAVGNHQASRARRLEEKRQQRAAAEAARRQGEARRREAAAAARRRDPYLYDDGYGYGQGAYDDDLFGSFFGGGRRAAPARDQVPPPAVPSRRTRRSRGRDPYGSRDWPNSSLFGW